MYTLTKYYTYKPFYKNKYLISACFFSLNKSYKNFKIYIEGLQRILKSLIKKKDFIFRLSYDKSVHTPLEFSDPMLTTRALSPSLSRDYVSEYASLDISEGDFLMFPCYLQHRVKPQKVSDIPRVTISFNIRLSKYGDNVENN